MEETKHCFAILNWSYWWSKQVEISSRKLKIKVGFQETWALSSLTEATNAMGTNMICGGELLLSRKEGRRLWTSFEHFHLSGLWWSQILHVWNGINHLPTKTISLNFSGCVNSTNHSFALVRNLSNLCLFTISFPYRKFWKSMKQYNYLL